jgi:hypothetical protein
LSVEALPEGSVAVEVSGLVVVGAVLVSGLVAVRAGVSGSVAVGLGVSGSSSPKVGALLGGTVPESKPSSGNSVGEGYFARLYFTAHENQPFSFDSAWQHAST